MLLFKGKTTGETVRAEQVTESDMDMLARYTHSIVDTEQDEQGNSIRYLLLRQTNGFTRHAGIGDWIIRRTGNRWDILSDQEFTAEYEDAEKPANIALTNRKFNPAIDTHRPWRGSKRGALIG